MAAERLDPAVRDGVLDEVTPRGVRFHHALLAEAAARLRDTRDAHDRLATAWDTVEQRSRGGRRPPGTGCGPPSAPGRSPTRSTPPARSPPSSWPPVSRTRAAGLLRDAREVGAECVDRPELRANVALDLADVLQRARRPRSRAEPLPGGGRAGPRVLRTPSRAARAEVGANLWVTAFVPDLPRVRRLEDALDALPPEELHLRATLLGRLTIVGGADVDATDRVRAWADEAVAVARATGDPVLIAQALINQTMSAKSRSEVDGGIVAADEVVRLAERAGRSDLALHGHQRRAGHYLNRGDLGAANQSLGRAEVLAALLPVSRGGARARCSSAPRSSH